MRNVEIEITLTDGQTHSTKLPSDAPLLHELYVGLALNASGGQQSGTLVQFPIENGQAAISFMSTALLSIKTRPAVLIQNPTEAAHSARANPKYVCIYDFLTPAENEALLQYALDSEADFEASSVYKERAERIVSEQDRLSRVLFAIKDSEWNSIIIERLKLHLPHIKASLGIADLGYRDLEIQLTASNDGDFFGAHLDATHVEEVSSRMLTFVYYFHRVPKRFFCGDLLFYGSNETVEAVPPTNNSLIVFASNVMHEVDLVKCPSRSFADSRFTVNGWLRKDVS